MTDLKTDIPAVFIALRDKETPLTGKVLAGITVAYALSPVDLIPDFIPVLGYLDDIIILPVLIGLTIRFIPPEVLERSRKNAENIWKEGKPEKWYFAVPVILIWLILIGCLFRAILRGGLFQSTGV